MTARDERRSLALPLLTAIYAVVACAIAQLTYHRPYPDFQVFWTAGYAVLHGGDPYAAVAALNRGYPFFYPYPAAMLMAPFALLPWQAAWIVWSAVVGGLLGLAAARYGRGLIGACLSAAFLGAVVEGQWSPLLASAVVLPWLAPVFAAKPSIGAALWVSRPSRRVVVAGVMVVTLSLLLSPKWPLEWWQSLHASNHLPPILRPWGWVLLLAAIRWRTPEGRLLLALSLIPQTANLYELVPLFLIPATRIQGYALACLTFVAAAAGYTWASHATIEIEAAQTWPFLLGFVYMPALAMCLARTRDAAHEAAGQVSVIPST